MKRLLHPVTFLATISTVIGSLLIPVFFLSLEESVVAQQGVSLRNGYSMITLPDVGEQSDSWSCAPNSAARVLKFYGYRVSYGVMKGHIKIAQNIPDFESFGTTPSELRNAMQIYANDVILERESSFEKLIDLVSRGIPVITLVRVDSFKPAGIFSGTWPKLHIGMLLVAIMPNLKKCTLLILTTTIVGFHMVNLETNGHGVLEEVLRVQLSMAMVSRRERWYGLIALLTHVLTIILQLDLRAIWNLDEVESGIHVQTTSLFSRVMGTSSCIIHLPQLYGTLELETKPIFLSYKLMEI